MIVNYMLSFLMCSIIIFLQYYFIFFFFFKPKTAYDMRISYCSSDVCSSDLSQSDVVGKSLFGILVLMSLTSWYLIFVKCFVNWRISRRSKTFLNEFWAASSLEQVENEITTHGANEPFAHVASHAIHARNHHAKYGALKLEEKGSTGAFVTRTIRKVIDEETARLENGLTVLASIGSTAPFVGLFGTVWGVYHALIGIALSDGVTVNRIAGPVGEALITIGRENV